MNNKTRCISLDCSQLQDMKFGKSLSRLSVRQLQAQQDSE